MSDYKKLSMKEKNIIFENVWKDYSENKVLNNLYIYIALAALFFFSIIFYMPQNKTSLSAIDISNNSISYDIYDDKEIIFDSSINDISEDDLNNIITQL